MRETPLLIACKCGHEKMVTRLLELGANPKARDFLGRSCKTVALRNANPRVVQLLRVWKMNH